MSLESILLPDLFRRLGVEGLSRAELLQVLAGWNQPLATSLQNADMPSILSAIQNYLDPNDDGSVALLEWETLAQHGTAGFYVERELSNGSRYRINQQLLPAMTAPLGADYLLFDPGVTTGKNYRYYLIEIESNGKTLEYGPYDLSIP